MNGKEVPIAAAIPANIAAFTAASIEAGYPKGDDAQKLKLNSVIPTSAQAWSVIAILTILVLYVPAVYGPIAAALVEFLPTRIRYTAMSLPYHIGNGWLDYVMAKISRFEDLQSWQKGRQLSNFVYDLTEHPKFAKDFRLCGQIQDAAGSIMHNIAEGFDSGTNPEFIRFL